MVQIVHVRYTQLLIKLHKIQRFPCPRNVDVILLCHPIPLLGNVLASLRLLTVLPPLSFAKRKSNIWTYIVNRGYDRISKI